MPIIGVYGISEIHSNAFDFKMVYEISVFNTLWKLEDGSPGYDGFNASFIKIICPHILPYLVHIFDIIIYNTIIAIYHWVEVNCLDQGKKFTFWPQT